jgi:anti-sigma regulatory factor (Ser/Thr protein kinase)
VTHDLSSEFLALEVPCDQDAPAVVRRALAEIGGEWPLEDGVLVASELVTNAVLHSDCSPEETLEVRAGLRLGRFIISVRDPGLSGRSAAPRSTDVSEPGGWGLRIVEQLAHRWGAERQDGYLVWAELAAYV